MPNHPCIFLDRDGVLNEDNVNYTYRVENFKILPRVPEALQMLKDAGYLLIIITNQSGIAKGIYTREDVMNCYHYLQSHCNQIIDDHYFAPYHPDFDTASLTRKPDSLMIEKAIAKYKIDVTKSWLIGDSIRDLQAAKKQKLRTIYLPKQSARYQADKPIETPYADLILHDLYEASQRILA